MDLKELLSSYKPSETGGAIATNRLNYQADWAICKILDLHEKTEDYAVIFEYHDDVVILDSSTSPKTADFFQIKTKNTGHWTIAVLVKPRAGNSYIGRLFLHKVKFNGSVKSLNFVSNARYKIGKVFFDEIACTDIEESSLKEIESKLISEFNLSGPSGFENITFLRGSKLSIDEHSSIAKGKLVDFMEKLFPSKAHNTSAFYKTIFGEIHRKSSDEQNNINTFDDLISRKCISKADFNRYLSTVVDSSEEFNDKKEQITTRLHVENTPLPLIKEFNSSCKKLYAVKISNDDLFTKILGEITDVIKRFPSNEYEDKKLIEIIDLLYSKLIELSVNMDVYLSTFDERFIKCVIMFEII